MQVTVIRLRNTNQNATNAVIPKILGIMGIIIEKYDKWDLTRRTFISYTDSNLW